MHRVSPQSIRPAVRFGSLDATFRPGKEVMLRVGYDGQGRTRFTLALEQDTLECTFDALPVVAQYSERGILSPYHADPNTPDPATEKPYSENVSQQLAELFKVLTGRRLVVLNRELLNELQVIFLTVLLHLYKDNSSNALCEQVKQTLTDDDTDLSQMLMQPPEETSDGITFTFQVPSHPLRTRVRDRDSWLY